MKFYVKSAEQSNGIFWVIDGELYAYPYYDGYVGEGLSKSGNTFNHKKLWPDIAPTKFKNKSFDYYPRGRVEIKTTGQPVIYMNPNIDVDSILPEIKRQFGLRSDPIIHFDNSNHYKCYLDSGYQSQDSTKYRRRR